MAFNTNQFLGAVGGILGNSSIGAIQTVGNLATLTQQFIPATTQRPMTTMVQGGQAIPVSNVPAARGQTLTKEIFDAGNKLLTRLGIRYPATTSGFSAALRRSLSAIGSLARRTPAGTLVTVLMGIGLSAYEANLLTGWSATRKRRRQINPANAKALRRSVRRIKAFHKMCVHVDVLKSRGRRSHVAVASRCGTCRKSPCRC